MQKLTVLVVLASSLLLVACGAAIDTDQGQSADAGSAGKAEEPVQSTLLCESTDAKNPQAQWLWVFAQRLAAAPVQGFDAAGCTDIGGGAYMCDPRACIALPYTGSCPHCPGGGE